MCRRTPPIKRLVATLCFLLSCITTPLLGQSASLALSSASAPPGGTASLNLVLNSLAGSNPAGLQWTLNFAPSDIASISLVAGSALTSANKTLSCLQSTGIYTCVAVGLDANVILSGTVAVANVALSPAAGTAALAVTNQIAASLDGSSLPITASGGSVSSAPALTAVTPNQGSLGQSIPVIFTGTNFTAGASLNFPSGTGVTAADVSVVSGTQLNATLLISSDASLGSHAITLTTPQGTSGPVSFTVLAAPSLAGISPAAGVAGSSVPVVLTGTNFLPGAAINLNAPGISVAGSTVASPTQITATLAIAPTTMLGAYNLTVATSGGISNPAVFTVTSPLVLSPTAVSFGNQPLGAGSAPQSVTLSNVSATPVSLSGIGASGDFQQTNTCAGSLAAGASCTISIIFTPAVLGLRKGTLTIVDSAPGSPHAVSLSGVGTVPTFSVNLSPPALVGGASATLNTVTLSLPAPADGLVFSLFSSNPTLAAVPVSVTVPAGATTSATFAITTAPVTGTATVTILASYAGVAQSANLTIYPVRAYAVGLATSGIYGGLTVASNTVYLNSPAPPGGAVVALSSSNPSLASVPASISVPSGSNSANFDIVTSPVSSPTVVTISATYGLTRTATLTLSQATLYGFLLSPNSIGGGLPTKGNAVSLAGLAPPGGATVTLTSSNPAIAAVPASVVIPAGASTFSNYTITTTPVGTPTPVTISASYGGVTKSGTLLVNPLALYAVDLSAGAVSGGGTTTANLLVLNGVAPAGGAVVSLASSNPTAAAVPAALTIPAGAYFQAFAIATGKVASATPVTISATYAGTTISASLTVNP